VAPLADAVGFIDHDARQALLTVEHLQRAEEGVASGKGKKQNLRQSMPKVGRRGCSWEREGSKSEELHAERRKKESLLGKGRIDI
jgi:hypothetical protein